jgi:DNA helicase-4
LTPDAQVAPDEVTNVGAADLERLAPTWLGRLLFLSPASAWALGERGLLVRGALGDREVPYEAVDAAPTVDKGWFFSRVTLRTGDRSHVLQGVRHAEAAGFAAQAEHRIRTHLARELDRLRPDLSRWTRELDGLAGRYLPHRVLHAWLPALRPAEPLLRSRLLRAQAAPEVVARLDRLLALLMNPEREREALNADFEEAELAGFARFFDRVESRPLTPRQRLACVVNEEHNMVLAGAGSGKTSVIVGRAGYLVEAGLARPEEILILAFGRKASEETDHRIAQRLPGHTGIVARTFHSLGLDILGQATGRQPNLTKLADDGVAFEAYMLSTLQALAAADRRLGRLLMQYLAAFMTPYVEPATFASKAEYVRHLKNVDTRTLRGERVRSQEEVAIANYLTLHGVSYQYEADYKVDTATAAHGRYRPDFYLPDHDLYIEHFAIDAQGRTPPFIDQRTYTEGIAWKRATHLQHGTRLIETCSHHFRDGRIFEVLEQQLVAAGVTPRPVPLSDVIEAHADGKRGGNPFARLLVNFVTLLKASGRDMAAVRAAAASVRDGGRAVTFVALVEPLLAEYDRELRSRNEVDFNDMINEATRALDEGRWRSPYRHILVDEFQDLSLARASLLKSLLRSLPEATLFGVGDDWQAIYRFTGSDITLTSRFADHFGHARTVALDLTFRFNDRIAAFASAFVTKNPVQLQKTIRTMSRAEAPAVTLVRHAGEGTMPAIEQCLGLIQQVAAVGASVYLLGRYKFNQPPLLADLQRRFPTLELRFDTVHASKGKEADYVLVLDVCAGRFGFPSLVEDDPLLHLVLPPAEAYPHAEERRLFYVAVTRARHHVYILAPVEAPSAFVEEMLAGRDGTYVFDIVDTPQAAEAVTTRVACPSCDGSLVLRASGHREGFYGCTSYPYCEERTAVCSQCRQAPRVRHDRHYRCANAACGATSPTCPGCGVGELRRREGPRGAFWGCSNYARGLCSYTASIAQGGR